MKKVFFTIVLLIQIVSFSLAETKKAVVEAQPLHKNVKMSQQAGTSTEVLGTLNITDKVAFVRKHNNQLAIISVNGKTGYVPLSEIAPVK